MAQKFTGLKKKDKYFTFNIVMNKCMVKRLNGLQLHSAVLHLHCTSKPLVVPKHTSTHKPMGASCHAGSCQAHWKQRKVQCFAQGHVHMWAVGPEIHQTYSDWILSRTMHVVMLCKMFLLPNCAKCTGCILAGSTS